MGQKTRQDLKAFTGATLSACKDIYEENSEKCIAFMLSSVLQSKVDLKH